MNPFTFEISLRLRHPSIDPDEVTLALSMTPEFRWKAGEPRTTPSGQRLEGFYESSYWCCKVSHEPGLGLITVVKEHLRNLEARRNFLIDFCAAGGSIEYFIGWFIGRNAGVVFDWELLNRLAALRIDLAFDVYSRD